MRNSLLAVLAAASACGCSSPLPDSCFVRGTRVRTPSGPRPIEELEVGDEVLSFRPEDGAVVARRVVATLRSTSQRVRVITLGDHDIVTTDEHPFWDAERRDWIPAREIDEHAVLVRVLDDGTTVPVRPTRVRQEMRVDEPVFNLTVEGPEHTFFAGDVAVHNKTIAAAPPPFLLNDTEQEVPVTLRLPTGEDVSIDERVLDNGASLPLSSSLFVSTPTPISVPAGGHSTLSGFVTVAAPSGTPTRTRAVVVELPDVGRWLVAGEGVARIRRGASGALDVTGDGAARAVRLDVDPSLACAPPERKIVLPDTSVARETLKIATQRHDGRCFALEVTRGAESRASPFSFCMPVALWPFEVGDEVQVTQTAPTPPNQSHTVRFEGTTKRTSVEIAHLYERPAISLARGIPALRMVAAAGCGTVDAACGTLTAPATLVRDGTNEAQPFEVPLRAEDGATLTIFAATQVLAARAACSPLDLHWGVLDVVTVR